MSGRSYLITPPTGEVLSAAEARTMLGLSSSSPSDEFLDAMIGAVVGTLDAGTGWLGRALCLQTWEYRLDAFPDGGCAIKLPYPVLTTLTSIKYDDSDGVEQTLDDDYDFRVIGLGDHNRASVEPVDDDWPTAADETESVRIRYICGYAALNMPPTIKAGVALAVKQLQSMSERNLYLAAEITPGVRERRWVVSDAAGTAIKQAIGNLLSTYRVIG